MHPSNLQSSEKRPRHETHKQTNSAKYPHSDRASMKEKRRASLVITNGIQKLTISESKSGSESSLDEVTIQRIKSATNLTEPEINQRHGEFCKQFPDGGITMRAFRRLSSCVIDEGEVNDFTEKVFGMFDGDKNHFLTFEEFTLATEVHDTTEKLAWLFDNVYDQVMILYL